MLTLDGDGNIETRQMDIPFIAASGGVVFSPSIDKLRAMPACTLRIRLLAGGGLIQRGYRPDLLRSLDNRRRPLGR